MILLDLAIPRLNGLEAALVLKRHMPNVRTVLFTMYSEAVSRTFVSKLHWVDAVIAKADGMGKLAECLEGCSGNLQKRLAPEKESIAMRPLDSGNDGMAHTPRERDWARISPLLLIPLILFFA